MTNGEKVYQVNLEELIQDYTWRCYKGDQGFLTRLFLKRHNFQFDIRWGYIDFKHVTNPKKKSTEEDSTAVKARTEQTTNNGQESAIDVALRAIPPTVDEANKEGTELYFSEYENKTGETQTYKFTTTRETTTSTRVEMQENYTLGAETNLEVNLGAIVKFGGSVSGSCSVTETKAEEFTKTLTWNIDTEIKVPSWNMAKASLYVYEIPSKSNFVVQTTIRLPTGKLPVSIRRVKDDKEVHIEWISDLGVLFDTAYRKRSSVKIIPQRVIRDDGDEKMENIVVLTTRGICRNVSWKNQHVKVECHKMAGAPVE